MAEQEHVFYWGFVVILLASCIGFFIGTSLAEKLIFTLIVMVCILGSYERLKLNIIAAKGDTVHVEGEDEA